MPDEWPYEYALGQCDTCTAPALFEREWFANDAFSEYIRVYPPDSRLLNFRLPKLVKSSYTEAVACERNKLYVACAVMVGRTLEVVCQEYALGVRSMRDALTRMETNGTISKEMHEWADQLRVVRNFGAHATEEKITMEDAVEALDFLQAILEVVYDLRPKFQRMKQRRASAEPGSAGAAATRNG